MAEIVLRKLPGQAFKADQRTNGLRPQLPDQRIQRRLPACVPSQLGPAENFDRPQLRLARQEFGDRRAKRLRLGWATNATCLPFAGTVDVRSRGLKVDALNGATRDAGERGDLVLTVTGPSQNLNLVPFEHVDHPFPRCVVQRVWDPKGPAQYGQNFRKSVRQNFRKSRRQNFRNPHVPAMVIKERYWSNLRTASSSRADLLPVSAVRTTEST